MTEQANTEIGAANGGGSGRFILWAGAVLGLLLAVVRVAALRGHLNGEGFGDMGPLAVFYPGFKRVSEETAKLFEGY